MMRADELEAFRKELHLVLESSEFRTSPQLREFLTFVSEQAFAGRTNVEQIEIADKVLHKNADFNPLEDATVRKLASIVRKKLDLYYANGGSANPVHVSLPSRSYIPQFRFREPAGGPDYPQIHAQGPTVQPSAYSPPRPAFSWSAGAAALGILALIAGVVWHRGAAAKSSFELTTVPGNFRADAEGLPGPGIQIGPPIGLYDEVTVRMRFTPLAPHHEAGLMIFQNEDRYVSFSRHFRARPNLEFGVETNRRYDHRGAYIEYDPLGGNGEPIWMSIRRDGTRFRAYTSMDGIEWKQFGNELEMPDPMPGARLALFASSGKDRGSPAAATFEYVGHGLSFHNLREDFWNAIGASGWKVSTDCGGQATLESNASSLQVRLARHEGRGCGWNLTRPAPMSSDWRIAAKVDYFPAPGSHIALRAGGTPRWFNLERSELDGGSIRADTSTGGVNAPDFPGKPPLYLRIDNRRGQISGSYSRNGREFNTVDFRLPYSEIKESPGIGIRIVLDRWSKETESQAATFFYIREEVLSLTPHK
jgi:hypothetical protein